MIRRRSLSSLAAAALTAGTLVTSATFANAAEEASAPPPPRFGQAGQVVLPELFGYATFSGVTVGLFNFMEQSQTYFYPGSSEPVSQRIAIVSFAPSADVVVFDHLTLGARVGVTNAHTRRDSVPFGAGASGTATTEEDRFTFSAAPRVGYVIALTRALSLWPRAGAGLSTSLHGSQKGGSGFNAFGDIALVYQPTRILILSAGPQLTYNFNDALEEGKSTLVSAGGFARVGLVF